VLIRRRDVRLRERKIGPYKYPTIDRTPKRRNPEKQSTQNTTQKNTESKTETSTQNRVKNQKIQSINQKNIYTEKERKVEGSHRSALFSSLQENN